MEFHGLLFMRLPWGSWLIEIRSRVDDLVSSVFFLEGGGG